MLKQTAIIKKRVAKRPISGDELACYLQVAAPNMAGRKFRQAAGTAPSFDPPYRLEEEILLCTSTDYDRALARLSQRYTIQESE